MRISLALTLLAFLALFSNAQAQTPGQTTPGILAPNGVRQQSENLGQRIPGNIVRAGLERAEAVIPDPLAIIEITEEQTSDGWSALYADVLDILFRDLNNAIVLFHNLLLTRAGRAPTALAGLDTGGLDLGSLIGGLLGS